MKRINRKRLHHPTVLRDCLFNTTLASGASMDYAKGIVVAVVSTLMAAGWTFDQAKHELLIHLPEDFRHQCIPEAWMEDKQKPDKGFVLVTFAILLFALIAFIGLATDVGIWYSARAQLQSAADAAALAGAYTYVVDPDPQPDPAARGIALAQKIFTVPLTAANITNVSISVLAQRVTVDLQYNQETFFARAIGLTSVSIGVEAIAEAAGKATGAMCVKPFFLPNTIASPQLPCDGCASNQVLVQNGVVTAYAKQQIALKRQFQIRPVKSADKLAPSQYYSIQLTGPGAAPYKAAIENCLPNRISCKNFYPIETGDMKGPTVNAVQNLIGNPPIDQFISPGNYQTPTGVSDTSRALVLVPIWDSCNTASFCPGNQLPSGASQPPLKVIGFALVFIASVDNTNGVTGYIVNVFSCNDLDDGGSTADSIPVRLVHL